MNKSAPAPLGTVPIIKALTLVLGNTYALGVKTHGAHWNVRGPGFFRLHAAFETQYQELLSAADDIAERIRALGANAPSSIVQLSALSNISDSAPTMNDDSVVNSLRNDHLLVAKQCRETARLANEQEDEPTADLLVGRAMVHEKFAWMLSATLGE